MFRSALDALDVLAKLKAQSVSLHMIDLGGDVTGRTLGLVGPKRSAIGPASALPRSNATSGSATAILVARLPSAGELARTASWSRIPSSSGRSSRSVSSRPRD